ncbi:porin [Paraburkholderia sp. J8-2]|uniref:porin n=1 Tax=Paraburkholderia sp. J8-2 TaxID=2805440 RepID=UPI002AB5FFE2|nr:porin [Paraburkholderia sp. J8-2]
MKKTAIAVASMLISTGVFAQSSVTLYGLIDEGFGFTNNAGGKKAYQTQSGWDAGDRWGLKGSEDLGGGLSAIFTLENGFSLDSGALGQGGRIFGRQAFVGMKSDSLGTVTFGRQYDTIVDYLGPLTANGGYGGWPFAHPYDNDNTDNTFRANNAVKYSSPKFGGAQIEGLYGFSNQAGGFATNRLYSTGVSYSGGGLSLAAAYLQANAGGANASGALATNDTNFVAQRQQTWGVAATYVLGSATAGLNYTHTSLLNPTSSAYIGSLGTTSSLKFDNVEVFGKYQFTPAFFGLVMYNFTEGNLDTSTGKSKPKWNQVGLLGDYYLSKRTDVYVQGTYQHVTGGEGTVFANAYITGSAAPSSNNSQLLLRIGMKHAF